mmetsp:Transcript_25179/g.24633  ORF Transcript_25179/g.24633 Transcript_25179/m.24633 type:complete len:110 (+) Transcript_25179:307-636(+)
MKLQYLVRAITNVSILNSVESPLINSYRQSGVQKKIFAFILEVLDKQTNQIFKEPKEQIVNFYLFVAHSLRFMIFYSSVDINFLTSVQEPSLRQVLRKYELFGKVFGLN